MRRHTHTGKAGKGQEETGVSLLPRLHNKAAIKQQNVLTTRTNGPKGMWPRSAWFLCFCCCLAKLFLGKVIREKLGKMIRKMDKVEGVCRFRNLLFIELFAKLVGPLLLQKTKTLTLFL